MRRLLPLYLLAFALGSVASAAPWSKFVTADKSSSFHYPEGWKVSAEGSVITISSPVGNEELLVLAMPFEAALTPRQHAEKMVALLKQQAPDLQVLGWSAETADSAVAELCFTQERKPFLSDLLAIKSPQSAHWFSYSAPGRGYSRPRALALLEGLVGSIATGTGSKPPATAPPPALDSTARAFVFVLEFALGFPFTVQQERLVREELLAGWQQASPAELRKYDAYLTYAAAIVLLNQKQAGELHGELAETIDDWLQAAPKDDPVAAMIARQRAEKGKVLIAGTPPLTMMGARAYSELMAYAELLQKKPTATVDQVAGSEVEAIRAALLSGWPKLTEEQREQVAGTPALWMVLRAQMDQGSADDRQQVRAMLAKLAPPPAKPGSGSGKPGSGSGKPGSSGSSAARRPAMSMTEHAVLMQMQQQTFNHWQWCMGYKSTMFGY